MTVMEVIGANKEGGGTGAGGGDCWRYIPPVVMKAWAQMMAMEVLDSMTAMVGSGHHRW